jgi:hypothetical protein
MGNQRKMSGTTVLPITLLKSYDRNIEDIVALGWGIFGWINDMHSYLYMVLKYVHTTWLGNYIVYHIG